MGLIRSHPYASAIAVAIVLIATGALIVQRRSLADPNPTGSAWGGGTTLVNPAAYDPQNIPTPSTQVQGTVQSTTTVPFIAPTTTPAQSSRGETFDFNTFLSQLSSPKTGAQTQGSGSVEVINPYSFIPSGLISTSTARARTSSQQALYEYGNSIGTLIQAFESQSDMVQVMKGQIEDRKNPQKAAALRKIGVSMAEIGVSMEAMTEVPASAQTIHTALAKAYRDGGASFIRISEAKEDQEFLAAITAYNAAADTLNKRLVSIALLFSASNVKFDSGDSGSVFMFSQIGS